MIIDIKKLKQSGKDELKFHFETELSADAITLPGAEFSSPTAVTGVLTLSGKNAFFAISAVTFVAADAP